MHSGGIRTRSGLIRELLDSYGDVRPNAGHLALAALEAAGALHAVVTQNIDGLAPGRRLPPGGGVSRQPRRLVCLGCGRTCPSDELSVKSVPAAPARAAASTSRISCFSGRRFPKRR